jgi:hypothetical protein
MEEHAMFTAYVVSLVIGGAFIGLSLLSGDTELEGDLELDGGLDVDGELDAGASAISHLEVSEPTIGDAAHGLDKARARRFNPLLSVRFWTFGLAGFGLTGVLFHALEIAPEPLGGLIASGVGVVLGFGMAIATRMLAQPVQGETMSLSDYVGQGATLTHALDVGGVGRIRVRVRQSERTLLACTSTGQALPAATSVIILSIDGDGRAVIVPESEFYVESEREPALTEEGV